MDKLELEEGKREFKGIWIPAEVWLNENLSVNEKVLLAEIDSFDKGEIGCFASNKYFGKFLGVHEMNVSKYISKLIKLGLIEKVGSDGRRRFLSIVKVKNNKRK